MFRKTLKSKTHYDIVPWESLLAPAWFAAIAIIPGFVVLGHKCQSNGPTFQPRPGIVGPVWLENVEMIAMELSIL